MPALRYFFYGYDAQIFHIKYYPKNQQTITAEVLPNDSEALFLTKTKVLPQCFVFLMKNLLFVFFHVMKHIGRIVF